MSVKGDIQGMERTVKVWIIPLYKNTAVCVTISRPHTVRVCRLSVSLYADRTRCFKLIWINH